jgi:hypothetical protein
LGLTIRQPPPHLQTLSYTDTKSTAKNAVLFHSFTDSIYGGLLIQIKLPCGGYYV